MDPFGLHALVLAFAVATTLAYRAIRKQTLTRGGAATGFAVGFLLVGTGLRGLLLVIFYQLGSWATKYKKDWKKRQDATVEHGSVRGPHQVLAVSVVAVVLSLYHAWQYGAERSIDFLEYPKQSEIACAVLAHHATSLADTLASELGMLSKETPILITKPWRRVPTGTNGGITVMGTSWSLVGGALMGVSLVLMDKISGISCSHPGQIVFFGAICGLAGSVLDSIAGATLQATYYDVDSKRVMHSSNNLPSSAKHISGMDLLTNEQVNLISVIATTWLGGWVIGPTLFSR